MSSIGFRNINAATGNEVKVTHDAVPDGMPSPHHPQLARDLPRSLHVLRRPVHFHPRLYLGRIAVYVSVYGHLRQLVIYIFTFCLQSLTTSAGECTPGRYMTRFTPSLLIPVCGVSSSQVTHRSSGTTGGHFRYLPAARAKSKVGKVTGLIIRFIPIRYKSGRRTYRRSP